MSRKCPQCGFEGTVSNRRMLKLLDEHFPGLPVMAMIDRGWLRVNIYSKWLARDEWCNDEVPEMLSEILAELVRFFECADVEQLKAKLGWSGELMETGIDTEAEPMTLKIPASVRVCAVDFP